MTFKKSRTTIVTGKKINDIINKRIFIHHRKCGEFKSFYFIHMILLHCQVYKYL